MGTATWRQKGRGGMLKKKSKEEVSESSRPAGRLGEGVRAEDQPRSGG